MAAAVHAAHRPVRSGVAESDTDSNHAPMEKPELDQEARLVVRIVVALFALCIGAAVIQWLWTISPELHTDAMANRIEAFRNIALIFSLPVALIALWLAWRRTRETKRQVDAMYEQLERNEAGRYHDRFQSALKMLESEHANIQLAGLALLDRIRHEFPEEFDATVRELFCDMASDKLTRDPTIGFADLWEAPYHSNFTPAVNARIINLLLSDRLGGWRDQDVRLLIDNTRIGSLIIKDFDTVPDVHDWRIIFLGCHISELEIFTQETRISDFAYCQIDRVTIHFWYGYEGFEVEFESCVIGDIRVFGGSAEVFNAANFSNHCSFSNCRFDNGQHVDIDSMFRSRGTEDGVIHVNGLRDERQPVRSRGN